MNEKPTTVHLWPVPSPKHANFKRRQRRKAAKAKVAGLSHQRNSNIAMVHK